MGRTIGFLFGLACALLSLPLAASGKDFPTRPVTIIVGYAPGGDTDLVARNIAEGLSRKNNAVPVKNFAEYITYATQSPGKLNFAIPGLDSIFFHGMVGPKGLPAELKASIDADVQKILRDAQLSKKFEAPGTIAVGQVPYARAYEFGTTRQMARRPDFTIT